MDAPPSVCPGYKHVDAFSNADEYYESEEEEEEQVSYVTLDLGDIEPQLVPNATAYRLIGLDTPTPYLQLYGTIMKGRHDLLLGTELIFTDDKENHDWNKRSLVHVANTDQRIAFQEVTLIPKIQESMSKGKQKAAATADLSEADGDVLAQAAAGISTSDFQPISRATCHATAQIDNLTGVTAPSTRAPRRKKEKSSAASSTLKTTKKSVRKKAAKSPKGKGKEKEVLPSPETNVPMDEDGIGEENLDEIYMDPE